MTEVSAPGTIWFRPSIPWAFVIMLVSIAIAMTGTVLVLDVISDASSDLVSAFALPVIAGAVGSRYAQRRRWVTVSAAGMELVQHGVPIFIEWSNIASAEIRRWGLFAVLEVRPANLHLVRSVAPRPQVPAVQRLASGPGFHLEVGNPWPTPRTLRAALTHHTGVS